MILAIDAGNTHVIFGCVDDTYTARPIFRIPTDRTETEFGYAARLKEVFALCHVDIATLDGAILSCVVPPLTEILVRAVRLLTGLEALVVGAGIKTGLHIAINDPGTVASDLVASAVAAKEEYPLPCIIADMGTATTLTVVDEKGRYIGGAIFPGVELSLEALARGTALLPRVELAPPRHAIAANTVDSMKAGIVYGSAGAVDGLLEQLIAEMPIKPESIVATGGAAPLIVPHCKHAITVDETLLLRGLARIWQKNQSIKRK